MATGTSHLSTSAHSDQNANDALVKLYKVLDSEEAKEFLKTILSRLVELDEENPILNEMVSNLKKSSWDLKVFQQFHRKINEYCVNISKISDPKETNSILFPSIEDAANFHTSVIALSQLSLCQKKPSLQFKSDYENIIKPVPLECFMKQDIESVRQFEKELIKYDLLYGEVIDSNYVAEKNLIMLRVIAKVQNPDISYVYPLNVKVYMFRECELQRLQLLDMPISAVVKVTVLGNIQVGSKKMFYATTNRRYIGDISQLGIINKLPFDLDSYKTASKYNNYAQYLRSIPEFHQTHTLSEDLISVGIDPECKILSKYIKNSSKFHSKVLNVDKLKEKVKSELLVEKTKEEQEIESIKLLRSAYGCLEKKEIESALSFLNAAISVWPMNSEAIVKRGILYAKYPAVYNLQKACIDFESALQIDSNAELAKIEYSDVMVHLANRASKNSNLASVKRYLSLALELDENNIIAERLSKHIEKKVKKVEGQIGTRKN